MAEKRMIDAKPCCGVKPNYFTKTGAMGLKWHKVRCPICRRSCSSGTLDGAISLWNGAKNAKVN